MNHIHYILTIASFDNLSMIIKSYSREAAVKHRNEPFGAVLVKDGEIVFANENHFCNLAIGRNAGVKL